ADGRFVVFVSAATELVAGDTNGEADVYVRDRVMGGTARVTVNAAREGANKGSSEPAISGDGTTIAFTSFATNLVAGDDNVDRRFSPPEADVFVAGNPLAE
ncbi:MAG: PD40 domain-containing protein, partial [Myxococcales bacterium]|nr:PD40 domain-containing protein [Myxococcales bacterium]